MPFNSDWVVRAFLYVQAELLRRISTHAGRNVTEETLRNELYGGLLATEGALQPHVDTEGSVPWHSAGCLSCTKKPGAGRPKQHDVVVKAHAGNPGLACEVKWLKGSLVRDHEIIADVLRLAMTRSTALESGAIRVFVLVGGEAKAFGKTLSALQQKKFNFRWSPAGRQSSPDSLPGDKTLNLKARLKRCSSTRAEMQDILHFGRGHYRQPPSLWAEVKITPRARWLLTAGERSWRAAVWELHHRGLKKREIPRGAFQYRYRMIHKRKLRARRP